MSTKVVKLFVMNDFACHFCYVGHHELIQAINYCRDTLNLPLDFQVEYRPFRLIGCFKEVAPGTDRATFYLNKMGKEQFESTVSALSKWSNESGVPVSFNGPISQTMGAQRLSQKAYKLGGQAYQLPLLTAIFKAYYELGQDIGDIAVLASLAEQVGMMTKTQAVEFLQTKDLEEEICGITEEARSKGITGVPVYVIDGKWVLKGSQASSVFIEIFKKLGGHANAASTPAPMISQQLAAAQCC
ncbi:hypothetical protein ONZ45_g11317 [Pleurotus djamor]|nr:hypothetical protein ONZ45_g11317 [Pleurotus djamor]